MNATDKILAAQAAVKAEGLPFGDYIWKVDPEFPDTVQQIMAAGPGIPEKVVTRTLVSASGLTQVFQQD